ncbi:tetratricopeptide (TPR) repeat protein/transcriptional regulator with XRE-family HTH domain [Streptomyces sp. B4I13]|uniref:ATP-binding protein n=1 Tax=Streptomyces sp. B4I13 TaxID=3042271 RepID=UPI0027892FE1|nr:tetratricopeptide repeat protein [Streptomyces sp. B4I13]MDQ0964296.1 tetratricopeptide (TPR) repeat protein/transcriptional regulator with XRE-family HTH domain [Streptomyces sp. B4I13]
MQGAFATTVRRFRLRAGLTQEALSERSGVSVSTIRGMETGKRRNPQLASVRQLASALGLRPAELDELLTAAAGAAERTTIPVPRQLPSPPAPFVGRHDELDRLDAALRSASGAAAPVVITAVAGAGGVGKSWLALHWAHRNADRFPDGQLFVDLRGFSPDGDPMDPAVAVRGFLDALGVDPGRIPVAPHAQAALFRSLVADKRMLLVLDNAADTAQVTSLLPGGHTCTVAVTSRNRLSGLITGHGARHLPVGTLTDTEADELLVARLGTARIEAEPSAVAELVGLCGGFPLALSIVAGRAHTHPHLSLADLADELRDGTLDVLDDADPAASLPAVLSLSHRALTAEEAEVFALLAIAPGPDIGLPAAISLTGLGRSRTRAVLRRLEQASLVDQDAAGRYRMHDLIRRYAATAHHLADTTRETALRRVLDFYTHTAYAADRLLDSHRDPIELTPPLPACRPQPLPDIPAAMEWFDTEHRNLLAAQRTAVAHAFHHTSWQLAWTLYDFHHRRGHRHDQLGVWQIAVDSAGRLRDSGAQILTYRLLGRAHVVLGHHQEAIAAMNRALALSEQQNDRALQAQAHYTLASIWPDGRRALEHARRSLDLYRGLDQPIGEANALNAVGWYAARLGEHDTAREHCRSALALYQQHQDVNGQAQTLDSLGYIDHHSGRHHDAVRHYLQAMGLYRDLDNTYETADTLDRLGHTHAALGHRDRALDVWRQARNLYRRQGRDQEAEQVDRQLDALSRGGHPDGAR